MRSNAAMALSGAAKCSVLSREQLTEVWAALWHALESSERQEDFSEFKHAATLKEQVKVGTKVKWSGTQTTCTSSCCLYFCICDKLVARVCYL